MERLFSLNAEGGPLLCLDAGGATHWRGIEAGGTDYQQLCAQFDDATDRPAIQTMIGDQIAIAWEMSGAGTADVFRGSDGVLRLIRAWANQDTPEELARLAVIDASSPVELGEIQVPTGLLAVLWAAESGERISLATKPELQRVPDTSVEDSAFVLRVASRRYRCLHDEVSLGKSRARRLTLIGH